MWLTAIVMEPNALTSSSGQESKCQLPPRNSLLRWPCVPTVCLSLDLGGPLFLRFGREPPMPNQDLGLVFKKQKSLGLLGPVLV